MNKNNRKIKIAFIDPVSICKKYPFQAVNPLGLCYIAEITRRQGYTIKVFQKLDKPKNQFLKEIDKFKPTICAFSVFSNNLNFSLSIAKQLKNKFNSTIIFGGPHPTGDPQVVKNNIIDFAIVGEAENTFLELLKFLVDKNKKVEKINGISFKRGKKIIITPSRERIKDLDLLPTPYFSGLPKNKYKRFLSLVPFKKQRFAGVLSSRGCPFGCTFCISPLIWKKQIYFRNPKKVVDEIENLVNKYKINTIRFLDNDFMINKNHALKICEELIKRKVKILWGCFGSLRNVSSDLLKKMKKAGCADIFYGIESFNQKNLNNINKKLLIKNINDGLNKTQKAGIFTIGGIMIGYPEDNEKDLVVLNEILKKLSIDRLELAFITPFPGTALYNSLKPKQFITKNFNYFDSQHPIIKTNISSKKLLMWQRRLYYNFYSSNNYKNRMLQKIKEYPEFLDFYRNFFSWFKKNMDLKLTSKESKKMNDLFLSI